MPKTILIAFIIAVFLPYTVSAETVVRSGKNIAIEAEQTVSGDYYVYVGPLSNTTMSGTVEGDMYAVGGVVTANGAIQNDLTIIGGSAQMHATVTDDVRIIAGEITVADHIGGDLFVVGGILNVLSTATIDGDVIFYGGTASIAGAVKGSVMGKAEKMRIDAQVGKNVDVEVVEPLTLGDTAQVKGHIKYKSSAEIERAQNAQVSGEVQRVDSSFSRSMKEKPLGVAQVLPLLISLFSTLTLYVFFRRQLEALVVSAHKNTLKVGMFGLIALLFTPALSVLLMLTGLGLYIGVMTLTLIVFASLLGYVLSGVVLGSYLAKWSTNHPRVTLPWVVLGTLAVYGLMFIPFLGVASVVAITAMTVGGFILALYNALT